MNWSNEHTQNIIVLVAFICLIVIVVSVSKLNQKSTLVFLVDASVTNLLEKNVWQINSTKCSLHATCMPLNVPCEIILT